MNHLPSCDLFKGGIGCSCGGTSAILPAPARPLTLEENINHAAAVLPEGWMIRIEVERGSGWVELDFPDGCSSTDWSGTLSEQIEEAIKFAIEHNQPR